MVVTLGYKRYTVMSLRIIQLLCIASVITGFIWATSDWLLLTVLVEAPVTPLSLLLMLYGTLGTFFVEAPIRLLNRQEKR